MLPETAWKATLGELELQMTKATFNTWLKGARLLSCEENDYIIGVKNDYARDWLEHRLKDTILRTFISVLGHSANIRFVVWSDELIAPPPPVLHQAKADKKDCQEENGRLPPRLSMNGHAYGYDNGHYTSQNPGLVERFDFASFVVGSSNRLAHAAALSVAENPGHTYNPLFIYGGVGLGKTHLLHAIGNRCRQDGRTVCYISSETFTNDLIQAIRDKETAVLHQKYRTPDVLLIDDIQFIAGKESTQEEMFHTFNELHSQGKQVVISSDRPPKAMTTLEERLQSRFAWGLIADIQMPDIETRTAILQTKAELAGVFVPQHVLELISHHARHNVRELEGALNKVIAYAQLSNKPIDAQLVSVALADLMQRPNRVTVDQIITAVCTHYNITRDALVGSGRSRVIAFPRQIAMYLARSETDTSLPQIGAALGDRDHSTILYGCDKIADQLESDNALRRDIMALKTSLYETKRPAA
jgi:chromosomal replication initiator protein